jgi:hypothetical protein
MSGPRKHVFISYVSDDLSAVDHMCALLAAAGIPFWQDRRSLGPGVEWKRAVREAINVDALVFVACFSHQSQGRGVSYMNEELTLAADQFRLRPPGATWLIPVRLDDCSIPDWDLGAGRRLSDIQRVDLFGPDLPAQAATLINLLTRLIQSTDTTPPASSTDAAQAAPPAVSHSWSNPARMSQTAGRGAVQTGRDVSGPVATGTNARAAVRAQIPRESPRREARDSLSLEQHATDGAVQAGRDITAPVATGQGSTATTGSHDTDPDTQDSPQ